MQTLDFPLAQGSRLIGRVAPPEGSGWQRFARRNQCPGSDEAFLTDNDVVHHHRSHANEAVRPNGAGVKHGAVANGDAFADNQPPSARGIWPVVGDVEHRSILDIAAGTDDHSLYITPDDGTWPHGRVGADGHSPDHLGGGINVDRIINFGQLPEVGSDGHK